MSYWTFEAGDARDDIGPNDGIISGNPTSVAGKVGMGLKLGGAATSDWIRVPTDNFNVHQGAVELWFNSDDWTASNPLERIIILHHQNDPGAGILIATNSNDTGTVFWTSVGLDLAFTTETLLTDTWYHVAVIWGHDSYQVYLNGRVVTDENEDHFQSPSFQRYVAIGTDGAFQSDQFNFSGIVDDMRWYDWALTAEQVEAHYQLGLAGQDACQN